MGYTVWEQEVHVMPRRQKLSVEEARLQIAMAIQNLSNAASGPMNQLEEDPAEARKRNVQDAISKLSALTTANPEAAAQFDNNWAEDLKQQIETYDDLGFAGEFADTMKERYNMPERPAEEYIYAPDDQNEIEEPENEQEIENNQDNPEIQDDNPELNENLNINQEINNNNNDENPELNEEDQAEAQRRHEEQVEADIRRRRMEHDQRRRDAENRRNQNQNNNEEHPEEENQNDNQEEQNERQVENPQNQNEEHLQQNQPQVNEVELARQREEERKKEEKRKEIKEALVEVEKALDAKPDPNSPNPMYDHSVKVVEAISKLQRLTDENPTVCPEFDQQWAFNLDKAVDERGYDAAKEFINTMKDRLQIANAEDVREAEAGLNNPQNNQQNVNNEVEKAEQALADAPRNPNIVLQNPEQEIQQPRVNELEEIKKQRELLQLEMEKLKLEQEKLKLERERLEALKKEQEKEKEKNKPKKQGPDDPEIENPEPERQKPELKQPVRKPRKINTRRGIFNEVYFDNGTLTDESAKESGKIDRMVKNAPVRGNISKEFYKMSVSMNKFNSFMQKIKGRTVLTAEEIQEYDRLSMQVINTSRTYIDKKDEEREDRIDREDRENTNKKFKTLKEKRSYMEGYKSEVEMDRTNIARSVEEGVEHLRQKMLKNAIDQKIKEMQEKCDLEVAKREDERNKLPTQNLNDRELRDTMERNIAETEFFSRRMKSLKPEDLKLKPGESLGSALGRLDSYLVPRPKDLMDIKGNQVTKKLVDEGVEKARKGEVLTKGDMDKAFKEEARNLAQPIIDQRHREENMRPVNRDLNQPEQQRVLENRQLNNNQPHM